MYGGTEAIERWVKDGESDKLGVGGGWEFIFFGGLVDFLKHLFTPWCKVVDGAMCPS